MTDPMVSPRSHRAASVSSAGTSFSAASLSFAPRFMPKPEPQYISRVAAGEHVDAVSRRDQFDYRSPAASPIPQDHAIFSEGALSLLNHFLDALLYSFLGKARSTSLARLRPAISEVLKARLARDALTSADEEIEGLIDDADVDLEDVSARAAAETPTFHLEEAFKVMRLRIMVFIKLGEFDEEDELQYLEEEEDGPADLSFLNGPTAVFLASVLEYLAERLLDTAGEVAWARSKTKFNRRTPTIRESRELDGLEPDRLVVQESDVEKIALNPSLGRLWRTWRKNYRAITSPAPPASLQASTFSKEATGSLQSLRSMRRGSADQSVGDQTRSHAGDRHLTLEEVPEGEVNEYDIAANIPLPMSENDVNEIEVPGLAPEMFDEGEKPLAEEPEREQLLPKRPNSVLFAKDSEEEVDRPRLTRLRSSSAPHLTAPGSWISWLYGGGETAIEAAESTVESESTEQEEIEEMADQSATAKAKSKEEAEGAPVEAANKSSEEETAPIEPPVPEEETGKEEKESKDVVAGVLTGTAALVNAAVATVVDTSHAKNEVKEEKPEQREAPAPAVEVEKAGTSGPVIHDGLRAHPVEPRDDQKVPADVVKDLISTTPNGEQVGNKRYGYAQPPRQTKQGDYDPFRTEEEEADVHAIGVARTSDVKIHSHSPSSLEQNGVYYSPAQVVEQARDARTSIDQNGVQRMYDEYDLTKREQQAAAARYQSPLREASRPGEVQALQNASSTRAADKKLPPAPYGSAQPPPYSKERPRSSLSSQNSTNEPKPSLKDSASAASIPRDQKVPPLQTSFEEKKDDARPPSSTYSARSSATRSTRDSASSIGTRLTRERVSDEQRERDFDALIANSDTKVFSLTPEHLRDPRLEETSANGKGAIGNRMSAATTAVADNRSVSTSSSKRSPPRTRSRGGPVQQAASGAQQQQKPGSPTPRKVIPRVSQYRNSQSLSTRPSDENTRPNRMGHVPREARVVTERLSDFADFMRSTAPTSDSQGTPYTIMASAGTSRVVTPKRTGVRLEARSASARGGGSDDLIDFIRKGPPVAENEHRISRTIAPFRTTMDSDDFKDLSSPTGNGVNGLGNGVNGPTSAPTSVPSSSVQRPPQPQSALYQSTLQAPFQSSGPKRTQHRVKDPYAMDFLDEDEDDDLLTALPASKSRAAVPREETLAEFLMATDPPSSRPSQSRQNGIGNRPVRAATAGAPHPAVITTSASSAAQPNVPKKRFEARSAGRTANFGEAPTSTFDMADFLRSSGPPGESAAAPAPEVPSSRSGRSSSMGSAASPRAASKKSARRFWQRKTNLNMS